MFRYGIVANAISTTLLAVSLFLSCSSVQGYSKRMCDLQHSSEQLKDCDFQVSIPLVEDLKLRSHFRGRWSDTTVTSVHVTTKCLQNSNDCKGSVLRRWIVAF
ncbi:hypothetical protein CEXT_123991 [Caerostris extrusa]|uniref:Uncharacterized protein n=1 Tax=Caerostris extrusa TaxID=172846 RepID=A0AAV4RFM0_CAEEX|nr:hypothetical protein CEXT_123991 [Caerostris extrusa]